MIQYRNTLAAFWVLALVICARLPGVGTATSATSTRDSGAGEDSTGTTSVIAVLVPKRLELQVVDFHKTQRHLKALTAQHWNVFLLCHVGYHNSWFVDFTRTVPTLFERFSYRTTGPPFQFV